MVKMGLCGVLQNVWCFSLFARLLGVVYVWCIADMAIRGNVSHLLSFHSCPKPLFSRFLFRTMLGLSNFIRLVVSWKKLPTFDVSGFQPPRRRRYSYCHEVWVKGYFHKKSITSMKVTGEAATIGNLASRDVEKHEARVHAYIRTGPL